jgi:citrate synthase
VIELTDVALSLMVDHDLASSTFAARIAASTRADVYNAVIAGLATLSGPLHGSASAAAHAVFAAAQHSNANTAVEAALANGGRLAGWGHRIYRDVDPRASLLLGALKRAGAPREAIVTIEAVRRAGAQAISVHPNIDFALAALTFAYGLPADSAEYIMAIARTAGWAAHVQEEYDETPLRFRPRAKYAGP